MGEGSGRLHQTSSSYQSLTGCGGCAERVRLTFASWHKYPVVQRTEVKNYESRVPSRDLSDWSHFVGEPKPGGRGGRRNSIFCRTISLLVLLDRKSRAGLLQESVKYH